jgi:hypothetical protein
LAPRKVKEFSTAATNSFEEKVSRKDTKSAKNNIRYFSFFALFASWREFSFFQQRKSAWNDCRWNLRVSACPERSRRAKSLDVA